MILKVKLEFDKQTELYERLTEVCIVLMRLRCDIVVVAAMDLKKNLPTETLEIVRQ